MPMLIAQVNQLMLKRLQAADTHLFYSVFSLCTFAPLSRLARIISFTADGWLYVSLVPVILVLKPALGSELLLVALSGFTIERLLYYTLKLSFRRRRPPKSLVGIESLIQASDEFSLPSGHTSAAFFFVTFLCVGVSPVFVPLYLWALMVGLSRVILGVHFPTDILAGAVIGASLAVAVL